MTQEQRAQNLLQGIEKGQYPRFLYKYWNIDSAKRFLSNHKIMFSRYDAFNDPFECAYHLVGNYNDEYAARNLIVSLHEESNALAQQAAKSISATEIKKVVDNTIRENILNSIGIFCMTKNPNNLLMWAHYAHEHEGVCLKFDITKDPMTFADLLKVTYSTGYMNIDYLNGYKDVVELLHHKSAEWMYEEEYRSIKNSIGLLDLNPTALCGIIFGCRTSKSDKDDIKKIISSKSEYTVSYSQAAMHSCDYKILIINENDKRIKFH